MNTVIWTTGLPGAGKTTLAMASAAMARASRPVIVIDGDDLRSAFGNDLGYDRESRLRQSDRAAALAVIASRSQISSVVSTISPYRQGRTAARRIIERRGDRFFEVFVDTPLETCRARRPDIYGLKFVTGVDDPYETPLMPDLTVTPGQFEFAVDQISAWLKTR